ncbi:MAG: PA14 domain-containing protein, partial [Cellulomonas sp.]|nr:PA14 domain-containing protein [Cellulomonas sp.]
MHIPPSVMVDSSGVEGKSEPELTNAPMVVEPDGDGWVLSITPDLAWLQDPARVYPVSVDPTVEPGLGAVNMFAFKYNGSQTLDVVQDGYVRIGNSRDNGVSVWRTFLTYDYMHFASAQILDAKEYVELVSGTANNYGASTGWASALDFNMVGNTLATADVDTMGVFNTVPLTQWYATLVHDGISQQSAYFAGNESLTTYTYKKLATALYVTTADYPTAAQVSPGDGARTSVVPTLQGSFADPAESGWTEKLFRVGTTADVDSSPVYDSGWVSQDSITVPEGYLAEGTKYYWKTYVRNAFNGAYGISTERAALGPWSLTTNTVPHVAQSSAGINGVSAPATGRQTVVTTQPTFTWAPVAADADGAVQYQVRIATGSDGKTGTVVTSGWQSGTSYQVPEGSLTDGGVYSWTVMTKDPAGQGSVPWHSAFIVNRRIGESGPAPTEQVGPVTVNLANGNAGLRFASPTVATVGGAMGLSFSFNSQAARTKGLLGRYYATGTTAPSAFNLNSPGEPVMTRVDSSLSFDWVLGSPSPSVPVDQFAVRWSGFVTVPTSGDWTFGVWQDDGARVKVGTTTVLDRWSDQAGGPNSGTAIALSSTTRSAIQVDYYENGGGASFSLLVKGPGYQDWTVVPSDWLSPTFETLPAGWSASGALAGDSSTYVSATIEASAVIVTDETGTTHTYTKTSAGGYTAPSGEYGVLALSGTGQVNLTDSDGTVYVFGTNGRLESATPAADSKTPATPSQTWRAGTGQLDAITDRASGKKVRFYYAGDTAPEGSGAACPAATGFSATPAGDVCRIVYPSASGTGVGTSSYLYYNGNGQLARIVDPGTEVTDFEYTNTGELAGVRTPTVNDWLAADTSRVRTDANKVQIAYTAGTATTKKVASITLPAADGVTTTGRQATAFTYVTSAPGGNGTTFVDRTGITNTATGHARTVTFDAALRQVTDTTSSNLTTSQVWDPAKDLINSATDTSGRMTTTIYDARDRVTDTYGPATAACFGADRRPLASCPDAVAHTSTGYDQGMAGLSVAYYNNPALAGPPAAFALGVGASLSIDWGSTHPSSAITAAAWGARMTGIINFPAAGAY